MALDAVVSAVLGYGGGMGEVVMDNVRCDGSEQRLEDCIHFSINHGDFNCDEGEDHHMNAGVVCHSGIHMYNYALVFYKMIQISRPKTN